MDHFCHFLFWAIFLFSIFIGIPVGAAMFVVYVVGLHKALGLLFACLVFFIQMAIVYSIGNS